jgi:hypothetical protein
MTVKLPFPPTSVSPHALLWHLQIIEANREVFYSDCIIATRGYDFWEGQGNTTPE